MSEIKWSDKQKKAFSERGLGVVVSAAAGSGKTSVLIERIIRMITDSENPVRLDRMLVVTFTKAAAAEIQARLRNEFQKKLADNPGDRNLLSQQKLLAFADICNNDKFYNALVRKNFHTLGVSPDFRIVDSAQERIFQNEAVEEVLENAYEQDGEGFNKLISTIGCQRNDGILGIIITTLNKNANSHINPEQWLNSILEAYSGNQSVEQTVFGEIILKHISEKLKYCEELLEKGICCVEEYEGLEKIYIKLSSDLKLVWSIKELADNKKWNELKEMLDSLESKKLLDAFPTIRGELGKTDEKIISKLMYDRFKSVFLSLDSVIPADSTEFQEDVKLLNPAVNELIKLVNEFREAYDERKKQVNALDFNDVTHLVLKLLIDDDGQPTEYALELRDKYDEILIDEYQDTNEAQDAIFTAISRNEKNLFLVGDVKQSVYAFRLAMPQIFIDKIKRWSDESNKNAEHINLDENYRSRKSVLDFVNFIFLRSMSEKSGDIDYNEDEALKYGAYYPDEDGARVEIDLINSTFAGDYTEDEFIADRIKQLLKTEQVYDRKLEALRPVRLSDICILCRKNEICERVAKLLRERGISAYYEERRGFFGSVEINTVISLLRILDNPLQDVPLMSVLMSPIYGFDADDLARIRVEHRKGLLFEAVRRCEDEKCKRFIESYYNFRRLSSVMSVNALLHEIYDRTGYYTVVGAMTGGEIRKLNLVMLLEYASSYESYSELGLSGFVRYLDDCEKSDAEFKPAVTVSENADVVNVMTIHKSKGLEFPIVFLESAPMVVNDDSDLLINEKLGIGLKVCELEKFKKYKTVQYYAAEILKYNQEYSEAMRLLYVALTRAKERLIITEKLVNARKRISSLSFAAVFDKLNPYEVRQSKSQIDFILKTLYSHPSAVALRDNIGFNVKVDNKEESKLSVNIIDNAPEKELEAVEETSKAEADAELTRLITQKALYRYPYESVTMFATKKSASSFNIESADTFRFFAQEKPRFARDGKMTGAQKGTATHRFMEVCDFARAEKDVEAERDRLVSEKLLSEEQGEVLDTDAIRAFFGSNVYSRIKKSDRILREQKFTVFVPAGFVYPDAGNEAEGEKILVQGVIDCAFFENGKIVVLDYKTDRVDSADELAALYHRQLEVYKIAAEQSFNTEVSELLLYSFRMGKEVKL